MSMILVLFLCLPKSEVIYTSQLIQAWEVQKTSAIQALSECNRWAQCLCIPNGGRQVSSIQKLRVVVIQVTKETGAKPRKGGIVAKVRKSPG